MKKQRSNKWTRIICLTIVFSIMFGMLFCTIAYAATVKDRCEKTENITLFIGETYTGSLTLTHSVGLTSLEGIYIKNTNSSVASVEAAPYPGNDYIFTAISPGVTEIWKCYRIAVFNRYSSGPYETYYNKYIVTVLPIEYEINNNEVTITGCDNSLSGNISIPDVLFGYPVTAIGENAFYGCYNLQSIDIPSSVTSIGNGAFSGCSRLQSIAVADDNPDYSSQDGVLFDKAKMTLIQYPTGNTRTSYAIPDSVTCIGERAFTSCGNLQSVSVPEGVTDIEEYAFAYCKSLQSIDIPSNVASIGAWAFFSCDNLQSIVVDSENLNYSSQDGVLFNKAKTTLIQYPVGNGKPSYTVPDGVTSIENGAFCNGKNLQSLSIPEGVTNIGEEAFAWCENLQSMTIPVSVTTIGESALSGCSGLQSITVADNNPNYSSQDSVLFNKTKTTLIQYPTGNTRTSYVIPDSVTILEKRAFYNCKNLQNITIPNGVTGIGEDAFCFCGNLKSVSIPGSVANMGAYAFYGCENLQSVSIGDGVTRIGSAAFAYCSNLQNVIIPDSVVRIEEWAFQDCAGLQTISLGNSVTDIGYGAFMYCSNLQSIYIPDSVTNMGDTMFSGCTNLQSVHLGNGVSGIGYGTFMHCSNLQSVDISGGVTTIGANAFYECESLQSIDIPDSTTSIGAWAFCWCTGLQNATIGNGVINIDEYAFYYCTELQNVRIGSSVSHIGERAFVWCNNLTDVYYMGIEDDKKNIEIDETNSSLFDAAWHYANKITICGFPEPVKLRAFCEDGTVIIGYYDNDNCLIGLEKHLASSSIPANPPADYAYAKIMWWKDVNCMIPVCDTKRAENKF